MLEIERKFLVEKVPDLRQVPYKDILQGYFQTSNGNTEERIRKEGNKYFYGKKKGKGMIRQEHTRRITRSYFDSLWETTNARLAKTRYLLRHNSHRIELDVYKGRLEGLIVAEVEFKSKSAADGFTAPEWFGREVTDDERYKNRNLALYGKPN